MTNYYALNAPSTLAKVTTKTRSFYANSKRLPVASFRNDDVLTLNGRSFKVADTITHYFDELNATQSLGLNVEISDSIDAIKDRIYTYGEVEFIEAHGDIEGTHVRVGDKVVIERREFIISYSEDTGMPYVIACAPLEFL